MTSIDDLFKKPAVPSKKRSLNPFKDPNEVYKQAKRNGSSDVRHSNAATVEDENGGDDDEYAGPDLPPDFDEGGGDEEGRFFGGGVNRTTAQAMEFVEKQEKDGEAKLEKIDAAWVRKLALNFEKKISKNAELRSKYDHEPAKFMTSEADLDADIKTLSALSEHPELYAEFVHLGCEQSLVSLLSHENTDIAIDAIEIINELIDEESGAEPEQWMTLVDALLEADLIDLLYQNFGRLDESQEADRAGVYHILTSFESLSIQSSVSSKIGAHGSILQWLLTRSTAKESPVSQNKQYAAEVLSILLQTASNLTPFLALNGMDLLLQAASAYRRRDPAKDSEEEEFFENIFDSLTLAVAPATGTAQFLEAEGVELCLLMLREGHASKPRALRLLDHAMAPSTTGTAGAASSSTPADGTTADATPDPSAACASAIVSAAGLKPLFALLAKAADPSTTEHVLGVLSAMLRLLPADSAERIRLLAKFVEKDYAKIARLVELRRKFTEQLRGVDGEIEAERSAEREAGRVVDEGLEEAFALRRLEAGRYPLQMIDTILAWLVAEDNGAMERTGSLLAQTDDTLADLGATLQEQLNELEGAEGPDGAVRDMLTTLLSFLE